MARLQQEISPLYEEHFLQPQQEVTEWINMYTGVFHSKIDNRNIPCVQVNLGFISLGLSIRDIENYFEAN
jgi:hypothetical protein